MQKIIPHLWFNTEAKEAAAFYATVFPASRIAHTGLLRNTPSGDCDVVTFEVWNHRFMAISAGPLFRFNPSVSFMINFDPLLFGTEPGNEQAARQALDKAWNALVDGGSVLMPLDAYPFSKRYGWVQDKYGVSWQLILTDPSGEPRPPVIPSLLFVGQQYGRAKEAVEFYVSNFKNARQGAMVPYGPEHTAEKPGAIMFSDFQLEGSWFAAMDSAGDHAFGFNEAISFLVNCESQEEIDYYWQRLSAVPEAEQCGWLKDRFGISWQISPADMGEMMTRGSQEQIDRVTQAFLPMKKLDIATLRAAFEGK